VAVSSGGGSGLSFHVSGDANPQFKVYVDGQQIGGIQTVTADHSQKQWQDISFSGDYTSAKTVDIQFINDGYVGGKDVNLYVDYLNFYGTIYQAEDGMYNKFDSQGFIPGTGTEDLYWDGTLRFTIGATPPPSVSLTANPTSINAGQSSTLTWSSAGATSCTGTNFNPSGTSGLATVSPSTTTTYGITCTGAGGSASAQATVSVGPASDQISVSVTGDFAQSSNCPSLAQGDSCLISVTFAPTAAGARSGTLTVADLTAGTKSTVSLSGTGASGGGGGGGAGIAAHWAFDGDLTDSIAHANGQANGGVSYAAGELGQAVRLSGGSYVSIPANAALNLTSAGTVGGWFYVSQAATGQDTTWPIYTKLDSGNGSDNGGVRLVLYEGSPNSPMHLQAELSNQNGYGKPQQANQYVLGQSAITTGAWHYAALTWDGSTVSIYLDGKLEASQKQSVNVSYYDPGVGALIGRATGSSQTGYANGLIDDVRLYSRALSASEVATLASGGELALGAGSGETAAAADAGGSLFSSLWRFLRESVLGTAHTFALLLSGDRAAYSAAAILSTSPSALDFGSVQVGAQSAPQQVTASLK
jgi:hypothetical protein